MQALIAPITFEIDIKDQGATNFAPQMPSSPKTVLDVLALVELHHPHAAHSMLRTVTQHGANSMGLSVAGLTMDQFTQGKPMFGSYLRSKKLSSRTVHKYQNLANKIRGYSEEFGWTKINSKVEDAWLPLVPKLGLPLGCTGIVLYAIGKGKSPSQLTDRDLEDWLMWLVQSGRAHNYAQQRVWHFRRSIVKAGLASEFPMISAARQQQQLAKPVASMPDPMRPQIQELLRWKQAKRADKRRKKGRVRAVTAEIVEKGLCRLYGYATGVLEKSVATLLDLVAEDIVKPYVDWCLDDKDLKPVSLSWLSNLRSWLKQHPDFKHNDYEWFDELVNGIEPEPESASRDRKDKKYISWNDLAKIPDLIARDRKRTDPSKVQVIAKLFHDELLMRWILEMPWRQRNLREAELEGGEEPNIFRDRLDRYTSQVVKPEWVNEELAQNPDATFWVIHFRPHETKAKNEVRAVLSRRLASMLEEYVVQYRPVLVGDVDEHTVFLNRAGRPMNVRQVNTLVGNLTMRYLGRRTTPHLCRDSFANNWLDLHPEDYLTVSKALWHSNIQTTLKYYGRFFNESSAMKKIEEWLDARICNKGD